MSEPIVHEPAVILQHRSCPPVALTSAPTFDGQSPNELALLEAQDGLSELVRRHGAPRILRMVRLLAAIHGQEVEQERPADRCLADGAALVHHICVRCGRDNR